MWLQEAPHRAEEPAVPNIGLRELKIHASEVVSDVSETRVRYVVTRRGEPVAVIVPYSPREAEIQPDGDAAWADFREVAEAAGRAWTSPLTSVEILDDIRR
jgi:prevent-host-death family protein